MGKKPRPLTKVDLKQVLVALSGQILKGRTYLQLAKGLREADPVILNTAPTFFGLTLDGSLELAQMAIARLYDIHAGTVTVTSLLDLAQQEAANFQAAPYADVPSAIRKARADVAALEPILKSIRMRRDEWLAHIDQRTVSDSSALAARAALTIPDLERAFNQTEHIVLELSSLYDSTVGDLRYLGGDDYETALDWIRRAKCSFIEQYERQFGSWTGPRPKDCSQ